MTRKTTWALAVTACLSLMAYAGTGTGHHEKMDKASHVAKLKSELNLSADQVAAVEKAFDDTKDLQTRMVTLRKELRELRANKAAETVIAAKEAELKAARTELMDKRHAAIRKVLTPEQQEKFDQMVAAHMKEGKMGHGAAHGSGHGAAHGSAKGQRDKK